jgi:RNA polymerase sigma-70 factor (ECF subfamily)
MSESSANRNLLRQLRGGDEEAARKVFDAYVDRLVALARRRLSQRLAGRVDPEDIVQSVYRTFFGRMRAGQFHINDQDDLCKLLMRITVHKTLRQVAYHQAAKRDAGQEAAQGEHSNEMLQQLLDEEPTPQTAVAFVDQLEHFLSRLKPGERQILEMRLQGYSNEEIAKKLNIYDRKIRRVVERIRGLAEQDGLAPLAGAEPEEADED